VTEHVHFGANLPQISRTWEETRSAALTFEELGFDSLWLNDHLYGVPRAEIPILEAWTVLSAVGSITERVELGTLVSPPGFRNPAYLAKVVATLAQITGGRVVPGIGAGWFKKEFTDFGYPFPDARDRVRALAEAAEIMTRAWTEPNLTFTGRYFQVEDLTITPVPETRPKLLIGGGGEQVTMKVAARFADIWNNSASQQSNLPRKVEVLRRHCETVGRDPASIRISQQTLVLITEQAADVEPMLERAGRIFGGHMGDVRGPLAIAGTPEMVTEAIQRHIDLGCTHFIIEFFGRDTRAPATLFAEAVMPRFRTATVATA
jgi:alkanesulfonate monooxygenase SsuD/methylene tetrahydromethanopterin reductase-like flavin-dependent oxidoreductase (luciferase family)